MCQEKSPINAFDVTFILRICVKIFALLRILALDIITIVEKTQKSVFLIPSKWGCPSGFTPEETSGPIAASINDLKAVSYSGYVCYGKI